MTVQLLPSAATDTPAPRPSDQSLVRAFRQGDQSAAAALFHRYAERVKVLAGTRCGPFGARFDSDDVVQSVFRALFHGIQQSTYQVPADGQLWGLVLVLALNKIRTLVGHHKAAKRDMTRTQSAEALEPPSDGDTAADFLWVVVDDIMSHLPESNRVIVRLRLEGHEVKDIAARIGRSRRTVERVLSDFRSRLSESE